LSGASFISNVKIKYLNGTIESPELGNDYVLDRKFGNLYVKFLEPREYVENVYAAVHFSEKDGSARTELSIIDGLIYEYNILENASDYAGGNIYLTVNLGLNNFHYSSLAQLKSDKLEIILYLYRYYQGQKTLIGIKRIPLDPEYLILDTYNLIISLDDFIEDQESLGYLTEALSRNSDIDYDLFLEVKSSAIYSANCEIFIGEYVQQILSAEIGFSKDTAKYYYNNAEIAKPFYELIEKSVQFIKSNSTSNEFVPAALKYDFNFSPMEVRENGVKLIEGIDYEFNSDKGTITYLKNNYFSGYLYADLLYYGFEWNLGTISTVKPLEIEFRDYSGDILLNHLEFQIQYDLRGIPGYKLYDFDNKELLYKLIDEKQDASLLDIYIYNHESETWELLNIKPYGGNINAESNSLDISYIADASLNTPFNQFIISENGTYLIKIILFWKSEIQEGFLCDTGFKITDIQTIGYYSRPITDYFLTNKINFDIDLTDFYSDSGKNIGSLELNLAYLSEYNVSGDLSLFNKYALVEQAINLYIINSSSEYQKIGLSNDKIILSAAQIDNLIRYDPFTLSYYLRFQLEYSWNALIEYAPDIPVNIYTSLELFGYDLKIKYSEVKSRLISTYISDIKYDLTSIISPADNDSLRDIGLANGYIKSGTFKQGLMLRQQLAYTMMNSTLGPQVLILDEDYKDICLKPLFPTGELILPDENRINSSQLIQFKIDYPVSSIYLKYNNSEGISEKIFMNQSKADSFIYEYFWRNISVDTGIPDGGKIKFKIILEADNFKQPVKEYNYTFIADYTPPLCNITVGDFFSDYGVILARPNMPIKFFINELPIKFFINEQPSCSRYRIINLETKEKTGWYIFNPQFDSNVSLWVYHQLLGGIDNLPQLFSIECIIKDLAGNCVNISNYNGVYYVIRFSREISLDSLWIDNTINLNAYNISEREFIFKDTDNIFGGSDLKIKINGFNYGTISVQDGMYKFNFGAENSADTLIGYS
ncbi:MAG: hypothetical protein ACTSPW_19680, partial [Promethearchaeota archaeon]